MNQRYILGLVLLAAGLILTAGCASSPQLAWRLQEGDRFAVKVHLVSDLSMMFGGVDHKDSHLELDCLVKQIDPKAFIIVNNVHGILVPVGNSAVLADALKQLIENEDLRQAMGRVARTRVKGEFCDTVIVRQVLAMYNDLLNA